MVKETVPKDRIIVIKLEDGLDWSKICPFLEVDVPKVEYPDRNEPEKFQALVQGALQPYINAALLRMSVVAVPTIGVAGWMAMKYGPSALRAVSAVWS